MYAIRSYYELLVRALAIEPSDVSSHVGLASIALFGDNDRAAAALHYQQALALEPANSYNFV